MLRFLFTSILVVLCLVVLVPLILLLFGETKLAAWVFRQSEPEKTELVMPRQTPSAATTTSTVTTRHGWTERRTVTQSPDGTHVHVTVETTGNSLNGNYTSIVNIHQ